MLNRTLFAQSITGLGEVYGKTLSDIGMKMYYEALKEMTDEQFRLAVDRIIQDHSYNTMPKPADFLAGLKADKDSLVITAWDKVVNAMARVGAYSTVIFDDPLIHGFIQGFEGGWPAICSTDFEALVWVRKDFERYYKAISPQNITCKPLIGISEGDNAKGGREHTERPVYIGDEGIGNMLLEAGRNQEQTLKELEG